MKIAFISEETLYGFEKAIFAAALRSANITEEDMVILPLQDVVSRGSEGSPLSLNPEEVGCIVPLGENVLRAFTGHGGVRDYRGAVQPATLIVPGAKLLPTYDPVTVQRQWKLLSIMVGDFIKAAVQANKKGIVYPEVELWLDPTLEEVKHFIASCTTELLSVDIETGWGQITIVGMSPHPYRYAIAIPFVDFRKPNRSYWSPQDEVVVWKEIKAIMESPVPKLGQNFPYDAYWLWDKWGIASMNYGDDTRLMHHALFPELEKSLAFMGARYTDLGAWKQWGGGASKEKRDDQ